MASGSVITVNGRRIVVTGARGRRSTRIIGRRANTGTRSVSGGGWRQWYSSKAQYERMNLPF